MRRPLPYNRYRQQSKSSTTSSASKLKKFCVVLIAALVFVTYTQQSVVEEFEQSTGGIQAVQKQHQSDPSVIDNARSTSRGEEEGFFEADDAASRFEVDSNLGEGDNTEYYDDDEEDGDNTEYYDDDEEEGDNTEYYDDDEEEEDDDAEDEDESGEDVETEIGDSIEEGEMSDGSKSNTFSGENYPAEELDGVETTGEDEEGEEELDQLTDDEIDSIMEGQIYDDDMENTIGEMKATEAEIDEQSEIETESMTDGPLYDDDMEISLEEMKATEGEIDQESEIETESMTEETLVNEEGDEMIDSNNELEEPEEGEDEEEEEGTELTEVKEENVEEEETEEVSQESEEELTGEEEASIEEIIEEEESEEQYAEEETPAATEDADAEEETLAATEDVDAEEETVADTEDADAEEETLADTEDADEETDIDEIIDEETDTEDQQIVDELGACESNPFAKALDKSFDEIVGMITVIEKKEEVEAEDEEDEEEVDEEDEEEDDSVEEEEDGDIDIQNSLEISSETTSSFKREMDGVRRYIRGRRAQEVTAEEFEETVDELIEEEEEDGTIIEGDLSESDLSESEAEDVAVSGAVRASCLTTEFSVLPGLCGVEDHMQSDGDEGNCNYYIAVTEQEESEEPIFAKLSKETSCNIFVTQLCDGHDTSELSMTLDDEVVNDRVTILDACIGLSKDNADTEVGESIVDGVEEIERRRLQEETVATEMDLLYIDVPVGTDSLALLSSFFDAGEVDFVSTDGSVESVTMPMQVVFNNVQEIEIVRQSIQSKALENGFITVDSASKPSAVESTSLTFIRFQCPLSQGMGGSAHFMGAGFPVR